MLDATACTCLRLRFGQGAQAWHLEERYGRAARPFQTMFSRDPNLTERSVMNRDVWGKFYGQATKGVRWMPRRQKAKKDAASCEKPRGVASRH